MFRDGLYRVRQVWSMGREESFMKFFEKRGWLAPGEVAKEAAEMEARRSTSPHHRAAAAAAAQAEASPNARFVPASPAHERQRQPLPAPAARAPAP